MTARLVAIEAGLLELEADLNAASPVIAEVDRALELRMTSADAHIIAQQLKDLLDATARHERQTARPEFVAMLQGWSDLPYFSSIAQGLAAGDTSSALQARYALVHSAQAAPTPTCDANCGVDAAKDLYQKAGLNLLPNIHERLNLVAGLAIAGPACAQGAAEFLICLDTNSCTRSGVLNLFASCTTMLGSMATAAALAAAALGAPVAVPAIVGLAGLAAVVTSLVATEVAVDEAAAA
ncbi:MAG: hypothetical protein HYZ27_11455, partial [Deltaproteobacteria bacterium]|nr:hypothetical protein [Deltaproteobacteria bacterium]